MRESDTDCIPEAERGNNLSGAEGMAGSAPTKRCLASGSRLCPPTVSPCHPPIATTAAVFLSVDGLEGGHYRGQ